MSPSLLFSGESTMVDNVGYDIPTDLWYVVKNGVKRFIPVAVLHKYNWNPDLVPDNEYDPGPGNAPTVDAQPDREQEADGEDQDQDQGEEKDQEEEDGEDEENENDSQSQSKKIKKGGPPDEWWQRVAMEWTTKHQLTLIKSIMAKPIKPSTID